MVVWCWVDNFWKFLQQKRCIGVAKWVLVLCCCSVYARGLFSLTGAWKSAASFDPFLSDFCITLQSFGKSRVSVKHHCLHQSPVQNCVHIVQPRSLCAAADPCMIPALRRPRGSAAERTGLNQRCPLVLTGWKCHWEYTDVLQHLGDEVHILSRVTSCEN